MTSISGIHHVTAICRDAQTNVDFYVDLLGLRLVKLTVNFDDPSAYHLYYGDAAGSPGSILTFFPYQGHPGRKGVGQVIATCLAIPAGSMGFWKKRLDALSPRIDSSAFGDTKLAFADPDGLALELVEAADFPSRVWADVPVSASNAILGIRGVTLWEEDAAVTGELLISTLKFEGARQENADRRFEVGASLVDVLSRPDAGPSRGGPGTVHHVAFRCDDDAAQLEWRITLIGEGLNVSPVMDRSYFHSIYFREPGGVLFEIATDAPGFAIDEPYETLGHSLKLPSMYEAYRNKIEGALPALRIPEPARK